MRLAAGREEIIGDGLCRHHSPKLAVDEFVNDQEDCALDFYFGSLQQRLGRREKNVVSVRQGQPLDWCDRLKLNAVNEGWASGLDRNNRA